MVLPVIYELISSLVPPAGKSHSCHCLCVIDKNLKSRGLEEEPHSNKEEPPRHRAEQTKPDAAECPCDVNVCSAESYFM